MPHHSKMMVFSLLTLLAVLAAPSTATIADDDRGGGEPLDSGVTEQVDVQLFQLNFLATDRKGRAVRDLKPEEIEIRDHGTRQRVAFLEPYYRPAAPLLPEGTPEVKAPVQVEPIEDTLPAVVVDRALAPGRFMVLVFDNYIASQGTKLKAIEAARKYIEENVAPADHVAVISFHGEFEVVQPFSSDTGKLLDAIHEVSGHLTRATQDRYQTIDDLMGHLELCEDNYSPSQCARGYAGSYVDERTREADAFMTMLLHVVRSVAPVPDAKALILFSNGFTRNPSTDAIDAVRFVLGYDTASRVFFSSDNKLEKQYDDLAAAAAEARVSIFTLNPGGAAGNQIISAERHGFFDESKSPTSIDVYRNTDRNHQHGLSDLARRTGGKSSQSSDLNASLKRIMEVSDGLYTVGYYPNLDIPSRVHDVKVKIRRKGVKAITRRELHETRSRPPLTGKLTLEPGVCSEGKHRGLVLKMRLDLKAMTFDEVGKVFTNNFSLYIRFTDETSLKTLHQDYRFFNITYEPEQYRSDDLPDPTFEQTLIVPCKALAVEVIATDASSGARGEFKGMLPARGETGNAPHTEGGD